LHPFQSSSNPAPNYKDARLRGLVLELKLSPEPVKLSEVRQLQVNLHPEEYFQARGRSGFPERAAVRDLSPQFHRSDPHHLVRHHAFEDKTAPSWSTRRSTSINPATIATRDLSPNKVFICEVFSSRNFLSCASGKVLTAP